jgi:3-hydroxybutyryl-CoA dehydratase
MTQPPRHTRGAYFEEFEVGQRILTPARTITEADIQQFAGLSGDYNPIHTNAVVAQSTTFGARVAHGLLIMAIASGLADRTGFIEGTAIAFREILDWKFSLPVFIGDTVHVMLEVEETKALPRLGGGAVIIALRVINQEEKAVMRGRWSVLIQSRPTA